MYHSQGQGFDGFVRLLREMAEYIGYAAPDYMGFVSSVLPYPYQMTVALFPLIPQLSTRQYTVTRPTLALAMQDVARLALATPDYTPESPDYTPESPDYTPESPSLPRRELPSDVDYRDNIIHIGESSGARSIDGTPSADLVLVVHPDASIGIVVPVSAPASASTLTPSAVGQSGIIDITDDSEEDPQEVEVYPEGTEE
ncbi:hypothetical protein GUJ93_ZPchr0001g32370 [Zizania palustris]|uniref:Uncharacterized protein n=1 Tax=Zizania palustris TaxID=103762 RepID=A0A8J5REB8_ZIZPA|nr:hypothetical protein GUJ93_ZPchr0001g32370 [Zizania palustris]